MYNGETFTALLFAVPQQPLFKDGTFFVRPLPLPSVHPSMLEGKRKEGSRFWAYEKQKQRRDFLLLFLFPFPPHISRGNNNNGRNSPTVKKIPLTVKTSEYFSTNKCRRSVID